MPDKDTTPLTRFKDRNRHIAEQRATELLSGGAGGWKVVVQEDEAEYERIKKQYGADWDEDRVQERERDRLVAEARIKREEQAREWMEYRRHREECERREK
jgi:hypothetical protein